MKKLTNISLVLVLLSGLFWAVAQPNIVCAQEDKLALLKADTSVTFKVDELPAGFIDAKTEIQNISDAAVVYNATEIEKDLVEGASLQFCIGTACVDSRPGLLVDPVSIASGQTDQSFKLTYWPNGNIGTSTATFRVFEVDGEQEFIVHFVFNGEETTSIIHKVNDRSLEPQLSAAYPCPASQFAIIDYQVPPSADQAFIKVYDLMGKEVLRQNIEYSQGSTRLGVRHLSDGIYFYSLIIDNKAVATKRLIVSK